MTADFALELNRVDNVKDCHVSLEYVFPHSPSNKITEILDKFYIIAICFQTFSTKFLRHNLSFPVFRVQF